MSKRLSAILSAGLAVLAGAGGCVAGGDIAPEGPDFVTTISRDGAVVGTVERFTRETGSGRELVTRQTTRVNVIGTRPSTLVEETMRTEDAEGNTLAVRHRSIVGRHEVATTAEIAGSAAVVRRESGGASRSTTLDLPADLRFDNGAGLLRAWDPAAMPGLEFSALDVRAPLIERVVYTLGESDEPNGGRTLLRLAYADDALRSYSRLRVDASGNLLGSEQPLFGSNVETSTAPLPDAPGAIATNPVRLSLVTSPYRISRDALDGHIRYAYAFEFPVAFLPPQTGEQRVTATPGGFVIDICSGCGPGLDATPEALVAALAATFWLEADDRLIARIGAEVAGREATDAEKMARLEQWARQRMDGIDFAGHFSAAEALSRGAGDCTESAVLLAALGRAAGIPTRVASGIVYSRERYHGVANVFTPHAWTLAFVDGEWQSFDMALEGFDASHIAFTISDGDPGSIQAGHQLAALVRWDAMTEVRQAPAEGEP